MRISPFIRLHLPPRARLRTRLVIIHRREIMFILLHRQNVRDIVKRDDPQPEVRIIRDLCNFLQKGRQVRRFHAIDGDHEARGAEAVLGGGGSSNLKRELVK